MLFYFRDKQNEDELKMVDINSIYLSVIMAIGHIFLEIFMIYLEANATNTTMSNYTIVCFNAREGWLPFIDYFKPQKELTEKKQERKGSVICTKGEIEYEHIHSKTCCCKYGVQFEFSEYTAILLMKKISNLQRIKV